MADPEDILIRIAVSGQGDVISALGSIGTAGESAFSRLADSMGGLGKTFAGILASVTGLGIGLFEFANHSSAAVQSMSNMATATGMTVDQLSTMEGALASAGVNTDTLGMAFRRLSVTIEREWDSIQQAVKDRSSQVIADQLGVEKSQESLIDAQVKHQAAMEKLGKPVGPSISSYTLYQNEVAKAETALKEARQAAADAEKKQHEDEMNDLTNVAEAVGQVSAGYSSLQNVRTQANLTVDNVIKGLMINAAGAENAIKNFSGNITELAGMAPKEIEAFSKIADFMHNSGDAAENSALGFRLFGRNVSELIPILTKLGGAGIQELADKFKQLGFEVTDDDKKLANDFTVTLQTLRFELTTLKDQMGLAFAPAFIDGLNALKSSLEVPGARESWVNWAKGIATEVRPIILDFFDLLSGKKATNTTWMQSFGDGIRVVGMLMKEAAQAAGAFFIGLTGGDKSAVTDKWLKDWVNIGDITKRVILGIIDNLKKLYGYIDEGVQKINDSLGTSFTTAGVIAGLAIFKLTGVLGELKLAFITAAAVAKTAWAAIAGTEAVAAAGAGAGAAAGVGAAAGSAAKIAPTVGRNAAGQFVKLEAGAAAGAAEGGAIAVAANFIKGIGAALIGAGSIALVGGAIGALIVAAALWAKDHADKKKKEINEGRAKYTPLGTDEFGNSLDTSESYELFRQEQEKNAEKDRVRRLGESTQRQQMGPAEEFYHRSLEGQQTLQEGDNLGGQPAPPKQPPESPNIIYMPGTRPKPRPDVSGSGVPITQTPEKLSDLGSSIDAIKDKFASLGAAFDGAIASLNQRPSGDQLQHAATGGPIRGPGTGTSDSVPFWGSNGEYVIRADGSNLGDAFRHFARGFSMGGVVDFLSAPLQMPRMAMGGPIPVMQAAGNGANHFGTVDLRTDYGTFTVNSPRDVMNEIKQAAIDRQIRGGGRKPSHYTG